MAEICKETGATIIRTGNLCKVCGNKMLPDLVALRRDIDPSWKPASTEEDSKA